VPIFFPASFTISSSTARYSVGSPFKTFRDKT
jgi:hypothetical protein